MVKANTILCGDCVAVMKQIPDESVDLVFADPPYFLQLGKDLMRPDNTKVEAVTEGWDQFKDFKAYDDFTKAWVHEAHRVLKPDGALWVIGSYHNIFRVGKILQDAGFWILNDIIWSKTNPMPNFKGTRFANAHETLIWCAKSSKSKYTFNYESMKAFNEGLQMRSDWYFPVCNGPERIKGSCGKKAHPTQKPEGLLYRILLASTHPKDMVLDPFFGTGTTGAVAKKLGRRFIGIEQDRAYVACARERIHAIPDVLDKSFYEAVPKKEQVRIPFGALLESGVIRPGCKVWDRRGQVSAIVRADGSLKWGKEVGSIHQIGALAQGSPTCNGWTYWYVKRGKELVALDVLRQEISQNITP